MEKSLSIEVFEVFLSSIFKYFFRLFQKSVSICPRFK